MSFRPQPIISLGQTHLTVALMAREGKSDGLRLEYWREYALARTAKTGDAWLNDLEEVLVRVRADLGKGEEVSVVLPPWLVTHRWFRASRVSASGQREVIAYEGEKQLPEGLTGQSWDFDVWDEGGLDAPVLLQALPSSQFEVLEAVVERAGLKLGRVESSASVYASLPEVKGGGRSLLLDLGASSTLATVLDGGTSLFGRILAFGADQLTQSLAESWQVDLSEAEQRKLVAARGEGGAEDRQALEGASQAYVQRLKTELNRTLALFRRQYGDRKPERVLLSGGGAQLPGLDKYIGEVLGLPVVFLDTLEPLNCGSRVERAVVARSAGRVALIQSMAYRMMEGSGANLNAQADEGVELVSGKRMWSAAIILIIAALLPTVKWQLEALSLKGKTESIMSQVEPAERLQQRMDPLWSEVKALESDTLDWVNLTQGEAFWTGVLGDLQTRLGEVGDVWLDEMSLEESADGESGVSVLVISGRLLDRENPLASVSRNAQSRVASMVDLLVASPYVVRVEERAFDTGQAGVLPFTFALELSDGREVLR